MLSESGRTDGRITLLTRACATLPSAEDKEDTGKDVEDAGGRVETTSAVSELVSARKPKVDDPVGLLSLMILEFRGPVSEVVVLDELECVLSE